jgi:hypothetical protein
MNKHLITAIGMALAIPALPALATNGYFAHGYGLKAKGMGGVATALSQDSFGGANNPASMVWAGSRLDLGLDCSDRSDRPTVAAPVSPHSTAVWRATAPTSTSPRWATTA